MGSRSVGPNLLLSKFPKLGMPIEHEHIAARRKLTIEVSRTMASPSAIHLGEITATTRAIGRVRQGSVSDNDPRGGAWLELLTGDNPGLRVETFGNIGGLDASRSLERHGVTNHAISVGLFPATSLVTPVVNDQSWLLFCFSKPGQYKMFRCPPFTTKALAALAGRSQGQTAPVQSGN